MKQDEDKISTAASTALSRLRGQLASLQRASPTSRTLTLTLVGPVYRALETIGRQSRESPEIVAANILSGWVAEQQDAFAAARQKGDAIP